MSIPNLPAFFDMYFTQSDGRLAPDGYLYNDQLFQALNAIVNMFNNGLVMPSKTTAEITLLEPDVSVGAIWFNTTLAKLQVKTAPGTIETITSA